MTKSERALSWIHFGLALLAPLLLLAITGCKEEKQKALDFGPEVAPAEIETALATPLQSVDPSRIKIGEFVHFAETQTINNRSDAATVVSDTGQTVVNRQELSDRIVYTVVQNKITYSAGESRKTSTEHEMVTAKAASSHVEELVAPEGIGPFSVVDHVHRVIREAKAPLQTMAEVFAAEETSRVTYHNLNVSLETVTPPPQVAAQPNCLNIPNCQIQIHRVAFDQIAWTSTTSAEKVSFEFTLSGDVPYLATLMNKCATLLVPINTDNPKESTKVLLRQCSPVLNFRWEQAAEATAFQAEREAENRD